MTNPTNRLLAFVAVSVLAFIVAVPGFEIHARMRVGGDELAHAVSQTIHYLTVQPIGTLLMISPFLAVAWICASMAAVSWRGAVVLMAVCIAIFAAMYYNGYVASETYMRQRKWTAATLAVGLIPFKSIPILAIALLIRFIWGRKHAPAKA